MAPGRRPDAGSLETLSAWAGLNPKDYVNLRERSATAEPLTRISSLLRSDPRLKPEAAVALEAARESMRHFQPHIKPGIKSGTNGTFDILARIIQQHFVVSDVNAEGGEPERRAWSGEASGCFGSALPADCTRRSLRAAAEKLPSSAATTKVRK
jgi:hypothetical protein